MLISVLVFVGVILSPLVSVAPPLGECGNCGLVAWQGMLLRSCQVQPWWAWVGGVSWCWELTLRSEDELARVLRGSTGGREDGCAKTGRSALGTGGRVETDPLAGGAGGFLGVPAGAGSYNRG